MSLLSTYESIDRCIGEAQSLCDSICMITEGLNIDFKDLAYRCEMLVHDMCMLKHGNTKDPVELFHLWRNEYEKKYLGIKDEYKQILFSFKPIRE